MMDRISRSRCHKHGRLRIICLVVLHLKGSTAVHPKTEPSGQRPDRAGWTPDVDTRRSTAFAGPWLP
jgi:hypothetical protein